MINSVTVLENLLSRTIPQSLEETIEYFDTVSFFDRPSTSFKALLLINIEKLGKGISATKWGTDRTGKTRSYISHLLRIGRILNKVEDKEFNILRDFSYNKYLELLTLPNEDIPKFILSRGKELMKMTRQELRDEIYKIRGKLPEEQKDKQESKWQPTLWDGIEAVGSYTDEDFLGLELDGRKAEKILFSGVKMIGTSVCYWDEHGGDAGNLLNLENLLRRTADTVKEIREQQVAELMNAS
jgi:hypothetical protein